MAEFPYLPLWTDAYIADTTHLTNEEHGVYMRLLMAAWRTPDCTLPATDKRLRTIVGMSADEWDQVRETIMEFFTFERGRLIQKRLQKERQVSIARKEAGSKGGSKSQANRKQNPKQTPEQNQTNPYPSPSSDPYPNSDPSPEPSPAVGAEPEIGPAPIVRLPLAAKGAEALITDNMIPEWEEAYPGVNVRQQLKAMRQWLLANPKRRKTERGIHTFIVNWLAKEQNSGKAHANGRINREDPLDRALRLASEEKTEPFQNPFDIERP